MHWGVDFQDFRVLYPQTPTYYVDFGLEVVNGKNVSIFDDLYLDASCVLSSLYYNKLRLLL